MLTFSLTSGIKSNVESNGLFSYSQGLLLTNRLLPCSYPVQMSVKHKHFATVLFLSAFTNLIVVVATLHARYVSDCTFYGSLCDFLLLDRLGLSVYNLFRYASAFSNFQWNWARALSRLVWYFFFQKKIDDALVPGVLETKREFKFITKQKMCRNTTRGAHQISSPGPKKTISFLLTAAVFCQQTNGSAHSCSSV